MKSIFRSKFVSIFLIIFTLLSMVYGGVMFRSSLDSKVSESAENYLFETSNLYASTFRSKLNDQLVMLESQARYFENVDFSDYNQVKDTIMSTKGISGFKRIAVADSSGTTMNYDGYSSGNIMMTDYFQNAMKGQATVSSTISVDEDGEDVLVLAVPITRGEETVGVITGTFSQSVLSELFSVDTFEGEGYVFVINSDGTVIVSNDNKNKLLTLDNVFDFIALDEVVSDISSANMKSDIDSGLSEIMHYTYGLQERIIVYSPVGLHDWYVMSVLPVNVITAQSDEISQLVSSLFVFFFAMIGLFTVLVILFIHRSKTIEKDNERYRIVNTQTQSVVFEYDFATKRLELAGNTEFLLCGGKNVFIGDKCVELFSIIHADDAGFRNQVRNFFNGKTEHFNTEIRLLCQGEKYYWFRVQGSLIRNVTGEIIKFIGNAVNVEQQVVQELSLKNKAERDLLTGLYNKITFESYVDEEIKKAPPESVYAFYIVDLDNFKAVNDRLGHAMGDKVLCNVANSLARVFTDKDLIGRIGGDEFAVFLILPESASANASSIAISKAGNLLAALSRTYSDDRNSVSVSASIGISFYNADGHTYANLFKNADKALYVSKKTDKDKLTVYSKDIEQ